ncbi:MAG: hypothetical protein Q9171_003224 [Xanthocarpia ochracea]
MTNLSLSRTLRVTAQGPRLKINAKTRLWETPSREAIREIFRAFEDQCAVIDSVQWFGIGFIILAAKELLKNWKELFPGFINGHYVGYVIGEKVMEERALPGKLPVGRNLDDEKYDALRPGIKIAGLAINDDAMSSTSGLRVQSPDGGKYVTVASRGFPIGVGSEVKHPNYKGRSIGFRSVYMDTPFTRRCEGILIVIETKRLNDPYAEKKEYMTSTFSYFGNGSDIVLEGCCGAVLWDARYYVIAVQHSCSFGTLDTRSHNPDHWREDLMSSRLVTTISGSRA